MVMPAGEAAPLEVVEAQLPLQLLVRLLGAVALLDEADDLLLRHPLGQRGQEEVRRLVLAVGPLDEQPLGARSEPLLDGDLDSEQREPRGELALRSVPPGAPMEPLLPEAQRDLLGGTRLASAMFAAVQDPHLVVRVDGHAVVETQQVDGFPEPA